MKDDSVKRSLAAIVMADVVGYSRLMGEDEPGTLRRLNSYRVQHFAPLVALRGGRIVDATGDSLLIEFSSVVDAVEAAIGMQQTLAKANSALAPEKRLEYRIGVNIGDVIVQERALFGDGVNVAARLQALAVPGGLCLSRAAVDQIHGKIDAAFDDLGPQTVKNISRPIEAFALSPEAIAQLPERASSAPTPPRSVLARMGDRRRNRDRTRGRSRLLSLPARKSIRICRRTRQSAGVVGAGLGRAQTLQSGRQLSGFGPASGHRLRARRRRALVDTGMVGPSDSRRESA